MRISFGQIYYYDSPNQHGALAYLIETVGTTWVFYDAYTGIWWYNITNMPSGKLIRASDGSMLIYVLNTAKHWLALWNSSAILDLLAGRYGSEAWQWRPYNKVVDGRKGYVWNVTISEEVVGSVYMAFPNKLIIGYDGLVGLLGTTKDPYTIWVLSLKPEEIGKALWIKKYKVPPGNLTLSMGAVSLEDKIFTIWSKETR
jgi:hypothetical protein